MKTHSNLNALKSISQRKQTHVVVRLFVHQIWLGPNNQYLLCL